ncbi:MAG TPA: S53 family peptidase [Ktedonobacteraceae bacterium]|nr:S53 family peptidase [Ktedonobacteraceae bacterium]
MPDTPPQGYRKLPGSEREPLPGASPVGPIDPNEHIEVTVYLRFPPASNLAGTISEQAQKKRPPLSREEYNASLSAAPEDIAKVEQFALAHNLTVVSSDPVRRRMVLAGTADALSAAFATELQKYEHPGGTYRGRTGPLHIPDELDSIIVGVFGLDNRPQARPHLQRSILEAHPIAPDANNAARYVSYNPLQVAQLYDFPTGADGRGQCIAIIELGGGYLDIDLQTYFQQQNLPLPNVISVSVDGGQNAPEGTPDSADGEVALDIEVTGSIAPGAKIAVYFAPNTDQGFLDAITQATHDTTNNPTVISISWGAAEVYWTSQAMQAMDMAFQAAATLGINVCCASGDNGSSDGVGDGLAHVDFPSSSPHALACGGTRLEATYDNLSNQYVMSSEVVWNDDPTASASGGGVSDVFPLPDWQANARIPVSVNDQHSGRGVPDVSGDADPDTGYKVRVDGQNVVFGGTSAVAPLWAGLIALLNQQLGQSVGFLNPILYQNFDFFGQVNALQDVTSGNNGSYSAQEGWDACTGLGSPGEANLLDALNAL